MRMWPGPDHIHRSKMVCISRAGRGSGPDLDVGFTIRSSLSFAPQWLDRHHANVYIWSGGVWELFPGAVELFSDSIDDEQKISASAPACQPGSHRFHAINH